MVNNMNILVINCGSSSLKYQLIDSNSESVLAKGVCERIGIEGSNLTHQSGGGDKLSIEYEMRDHKTAVSLVLQQLTNQDTGVLSSLKEIDAVGHRVVHGGEKFAESTIITEGVLQAIEECNTLAPLHNPANLIGIRACMELMPGVPMVAVFDTAFHQTMPKVAYLYGLPYHYYEKNGIRKYGFHGTSHKFVSERAAELLKKDKKDTKIIVCHLGNGSSVCAVDGGKSVDTSMGLTPLEGLIMGTRSGSIDPAIVELIGRMEDKSMEDVLSILNKDSGLLGMSGGLSSDFRDLVNAASEGNKKADIALEAFAYHVAQYIGSYAMAMNGVDAIVFTAGAGENNSDVRRRIMNRIRFLGVKMNEEMNQLRGEEVLLSTQDSNVNVYIIPTNEELAIARDTLQLIQ